MDTIRDSSFGQIVNLLSGGRFMQHEDVQQFQLYLQEIKHDGTDRMGSTMAAEDDKGDLEACSSGDQMIGWYSEADPENPQNWAKTKKIFVGSLICATTFTFYLGSSIYVPGEPYIAREFQISETASSLGMALFIVGYGLGPMLWSPLSEVPAIGRTTIYVTTFAIFVVLLIPTSLVASFAGLLVLRFLLGFFGSPCLAIAGATFQDIFPPDQLFYIIGTWAGMAPLAPALGPLLSAYSIPVFGWRWSQWENLWLAGPILILILVSLPETSASTILLRRAQRLRKATGNNALRAQTEISRSQTRWRYRAFDTLIKPWEINCLDPAVLYTTLYTGLVYGIFYVFFESFPLVYQDMYMFDVGQMSLAFLSIAVACFVAVPAYMWCSRRWVQSRITPDFTDLEHLLVAGLLGGWLLPAGLFIFAFASRPSIHWVVSMIGVSMSTTGIYFITQVMFLYVPFVYPRYAASLLAANGLSRSLLAASAILFAPPMFSKLGVDGGVGLLAGLAVLFWGGLWVLFVFGAGMRARSRFAISS